jgi:hypothetical protein
MSAARPIPELLPAQLLKPRKRRGYIRNIQDRCNSVCDHN